MRHAKIFSGSSHPMLVDAICERLGVQPAKCELKKFSNGETSVSISTSVRDQDVFIVQSGSHMINDNIMELLIMINACKGGSAKSITAVMPYFPYSRQSKKKSHRGAITARLLANLLSVAGVHHVITIDLHATQMQGFFGQPVDNLYAEPLFARWIRNHVETWKEGVVVSKNPGGTKRVTSLADALKLNFGIVTTEKRRPHNMSMSGSMMLESMGADAGGDVDNNDVESVRRIDPLARVNEERRGSHDVGDHRGVNGTGSSGSHLQPPHHTPEHASSPLARSALAEVASHATPPSLTRAHTVAAYPTDSEDEEEEYTDERAQDVITGRLVQGHIVDDDHPSPDISAMSNSISNLALQRSTTFDDTIPDPMASSVLSVNSSRVGPGHEHIGVDHHAASSDDEEDILKQSELEHTITLVGNVRDRTVFIVDDMIDKAGTWIAAAETVVKRGGAKKVYCIASHGLFGGDCLEEMNACDCIDHIVVTNSFPIPSEKLKSTQKLIVLDISNLLSEAIRRNHYGESISQLFWHYDD